MILDHIKISLQFSGRRHRRVDPERASLWRLTKWGLGQSGDPPRWSSFSLVRLAPSTFRAPRTVFVFGRPSRTSRRRPASHSSVNPALSFLVGRETSGVSIPYAEGKPHLDIVQFKYGRAFSLTTLVSLRRSILMKMPHRDAHRRRAAPASRSVRADEATCSHRPPSHADS
jgi:hypothetical protein